MHWVSSQAELLVAVAALSGSVVPAVAGDIYAPVPVSHWEDVLSEIRLGLNAHAVAPNFLPVANPSTYDLTHISDVSFDVLFKTPSPDVFSWIGSPRPNLGGTVSLEGRESTGHAALTWHAQLFSTPLYLEGTFGAAINSGYLSNAPSGYRNMGCRVQFYEAFGAGVELGPNATATLTWEHTSNAGLCAQNDGLSDLGIRVGYRF